MLGQRNNRLWWYNVVRGLTLEEQTKKPITEHTIYMGCLPILTTQQSDVAYFNDSAIREKLVSIFAGNKFVREIDKGKASVSYKVELPEPLGSEPAPETETQMFQMFDPMKIRMEYAIAEIDPDHGVEDTRHKHFDMNATLYYDGFLYFFFIEAPRFDFFPYNYRRHASQLHEWLLKLLSQETAFQVKDTKPTLSDDAIHVSYLEELPAGKNKEERRSDMVVDSPLYFKISLLKKLMVWDSALYKEVAEMTGDSLEDLRDEIPSIEEQIRDNTMTLHLLCRDQCAQFYRCHMLNNILRRQNREAAEMIDTITKGMMSFYNIPLPNVIRRLRRCNELGHQLASIYVSLPNIEIAKNELDRAVSEIRSLGRNEEDKFLISFAGTLERRLPKTEEVVFTQSVNEMLRQDVAEIRAQINNQILLIAAISTFAAILLAALL
jgi:hypothetical protein